MAPKFVLVAVVSVLVLLIGTNPSTVSAMLPPPMKMGPTNHSSIAIGGVVFCQTCKLPGYVDYLNASPVKGAVVRVSCFDKYWKLISELTTSDATGFFYMRWPDVMSFDPSRCKAYIDWSPLSFCNVPMYWPGTHGGNLYQVEVKNVSCGTEGTYSPGVLFLGPPTGAKCPVKH